MVVLSGPRLLCLISELLIKVRLVTLHSNTNLFTALLIIIRASAEGILFEECATQSSLVRWIRPTVLGKCLGRWGIRTSNKPGNRRNNVRRVVTIISLLFLRASAVTYIGWRGVYRWCSAMVPVVNRGAIETLNPRSLAMAIRPPPVFSVIKCVLLLLPRVVTSAT